MRKKHSHFTSSLHDLYDVKYLADKIGYSIELCFDSHSSKCTVRAYKDDPLRPVFIFIADDLALLLNHAWLALDFIRNNDLPF